MRSEFKSNHVSDSNGNPTGGTTYGQGFAIGWQNGPLGRDIDRIQPNGAFVEDIIAAALDRLDYYQRSRFQCKENAEAMHHLNEALRWLQERTAKREERQVEGTHVA